MVKSWVFEGDGGDGADVAAGKAYLLRHRETGVEREFTIELAAGKPGPAPSAVSDVLRHHLNEEDPPLRVRLDHSGNEISLD